MSIDKRHLSKTLAHALRHAPWVYELELDSEGWTSAEVLLTSLRQRRRWQQLTLTDIQEVVDTSAKRRYEMSHGRIRALYGHSIDAKIEKETAVPPPILYHGTAPATATIILQEGLKPMSRQYVHLSLDTDMAQQVGQRKGEHPIILHIDATRAHQEGVTFYKGNERVWLADHIPPTYITDPTK